MLGFDLAQTFYLDKDAVQSSATAALTKIDLYFYAKPTQGKTASGIYSPGFAVYIGGVQDDGSPDLSLIYNQFSGRREYEDINVSTSGDTATTITFKQPIVLPTNRTYCILIKFDGSDPGFKLWYNKAGDVKLGTTTKTQVTSGKVDGYFFTLSNGKSLTPQRDADLSFKLYVAKYTSTESNFSIKNRAYEILKVNSIIGNFLGGETVYQKAANSTGTISVSANSTVITGTGTTFTSVLTAGDKFVITDGSVNNTCVRTVAAVGNATSITIDTNPSFSTASGAYYKTVIGGLYIAEPLTDYVILQDVNSNTTNLMTVGANLYGVDSHAYATINAISNYTLNSVVPNFYIETPAGTSVDTALNFANTTLAFTPGQQQNVTIGERRILNKYPVMMASKTNELAISGSHASLNAVVTFKTSNPYASPLVREENLDLFGEHYVINNDATNEVTGRGNGLARYVSKMVTLSADQRAEDLKIYLRAYRPANTSILVYGKFRNSEDVETLDAKQWTLMTQTSNTGVISNPSNIYDIIEQEHSVPFYPTTANTANGSFATSLSNSVIVGTTTDVNTYITSGALVRVYSPLFPTTYIVDTVVTSNTTTFTLSKAISNSSLVQTGLKVDTLDNPKSGYLDIQNKNVLTYHNETYATFVGYDTFQLKVVLLSDNLVSIPYLDDIRAIAVSA